jgi:hypothetical protein
MAIKRNPEAAKLYLHKDKESYIAKRPCKIIFPKRYEDKALAFISTESYVYGFFMVLFDNGEYTVLNVLTFVKLIPQKTEIIDIDGEDYYQMTFFTGDLVMPSKVLVTDDAVYPVMQEMYFNAKIPFYATYDDLGNLFRTALTHAGSRVASNYEVFELIVAAISRSAKDKTLNIRHTGTKYSDFTLDQIVYAGLNNVFLSVNSTTSRLNGAYFEDGVVSSLVKPAKKTDIVEAVLRA